MGARMQEEQTKQERIAELRQQVAGVKAAIKRAPDPSKEKDDAAVRKRERWLQLGMATRFQPGHGGGRQADLNRTGGGAKRRRHPTHLWRWITLFLEMTSTEAEELAPEDLTMVQAGALEFAGKVASGQWAMLKEVLNRELGLPREGLGTDDEEVPTLVRLPFDGPRMADPGVRTVP